MIDHHPDDSLLLALASGMMDSGSSIVVASHVENCLKAERGPVVAATDYVRLYAEQIRAFVPGRYVVLGTDGFGRSDGRAALRRHFEVDRHHIAVAALKALHEEGKIDAATVNRAMQKFGIEPTTPNPLSV